MKNKTLAISAINFFEGGPLSVLMDCLSFLNDSMYIKEYKLLALVHKKELFDLKKFSNIQFIEFPKSRSSYFFRLYYEYIYFKKFSKKHDVNFWLSLHDITPNVGDISQAVYCHNPAPFNSLNFSDLMIQPTQFFFKLFYKFLYKININKNKFVIVQQLWLKNKFINLFQIDSDKILISKPIVPKVPSKFLNINNKNSKINFFYPTFPRPFKNIEVICNAVIELNKLNKLNFDITITIDGSENIYAKKIVDKYNLINNINFIGLVSREKVYEYFSRTNCLLFPSKLETWGLPISECIQFNKPMIVSNLDYAKETVGDYDKALFFNPNDSLELSKKMRELIENGNINFDLTESIKYPKPFVNSWENLFKKIL